MPRNLVQRSSWSCSAPRCAGVPASLPEDARRRWSSHPGALTPIVTKRDGLVASPGRYGWDGGYGTSWSSDPREDMVAILMTQRAGFPLFSRVHLDFWASVYQAIDD